MDIATLKRVTVTSETALQSWLAKFSGSDARVMLVTHTKGAAAKQVGREAVEKAVTRHGWTPGLRYTLGTGLLGHVIERDLG